MNLFLLFYYFVVFIFGTCIGSFLNCVIYRIENKKSFVKGRSFCPNCKHTLSWLDLIPIFSFIFLKGKCRYCKEKISMQYPVLEIITGIIFLLISSGKFQIANQFQVVNFLELGFLFYIASVLIIIFVYDLKHYLIPDKVLLPAIVVAFLFRLIFNFKEFIPSYLLAAGVSFAFFLIIFLLSSGKGMGFGDVKLVILLGLILGFPNIIAGLFLAFFFGAIIGLILMIFRKKTLKSEIPFGPFLIIGTLITMLYGQPLIDWYINLFRI